MIRLLRQENIFVGNKLTYWPNQMLMCQSISLHIPAMFSRLEIQELNTRIYSLAASDDVMGSSLSTLIQALLSIVIVHIQ